MYIHGELCFHAAKVFYRLLGGHSRSQRLHGRAGKFLYGRKGILSWWFVLVAAPRGAAAALEPSAVAAVAAVVVAVATVIKTEIQLRLR